MDELGRRLLTAIQDGFPIVEHPYRVLGKEFGISEDETLDRIREMRRQGLIQRIGASFDSRQLGYSSTLVGMKVSPAGLEAAGRAVEQYPGVTHCYEREHEHNLWFTVIAPSPDEVESIVYEITQRTGASKVLNVPARRVFKIRVRFDLASRKRAG